jgi:hypothetical protein
LQRETPKGNHGDDILRSEEDDRFAIGPHMSFHPA